MGDQIRISSFANPGGVTVTVGPGVEYDFTHANGQRDVVDVGETTINCQIHPPAGGYPWGFLGRSGGDHFTVSWLDDALDPAVTLITDAPFITPTHVSGVDACDLRVSDSAGVNSGSISFSVSGQLDFGIVQWTLEASFGLEPPPPPGFLPSVLVGDSGNPDNPANSRGFGGIAYEFEIGLYEVTNEEYAMFLNNKLAVVDRLGLHNGGMQIIRQAGPRFVVQAGRERHPVTHVSVFDAMRFCNWLHNGRGNGSTETGAYPLLGGSVLPTNAATVEREPDAQWFLPSASEWHKAAFYTGTGATYYLFPGQNTVPSTECENYGATRDVALAVDDPATAGNSHYGVRGMGGNVFEWVEPAFSPGRVYPAFGTSWPGGSVAMQSTWYWEAADGPLSEYSVLGFRVAKIPAVSAPLELVAIELAPDHSEATVTWTSSSGKTYTIEASSNLTEWTQLDDSVEGQETTTSYTEVAIPSGDRFYRVLEN